MRQDAETVLAHPARRRLYDLIEQKPAISLSELARRADMHWTSVAQQVARLTRAGLVRSVRAGRRRLLFVASAMDPLAARERSLLAEPACRRVAGAIAEHPGRRVHELCEELGMSERAVYHHVKRLLLAGLVRVRREHALRGFEATATLYGALAREP